MAEPTLTIGVTTTALGTAVLAALGVDHISLIWGLIGALSALFFQSPKTSTLRAVAYIAISVPIGAVLGLAASDGFGVASKNIGHFFCLIAGAGWQSIVGAGIESAVSRIKNLGNSDSGKEGQ